MGAFVRSLRLKYRFPLLFCAAACLFARAAGAGKAISTQQIRQAAIEESLIPIHPGVPGKSPFWNIHARQFTYAPAFDFKPIAGAASYRFTATSSGDGMSHSFVASKPWAPLSPIWATLPTGDVTLKVEALAAGGRDLGLAGARSFYRAAVFNGGPYHPALRGYGQSARMAMDYLFHQPHVQRWLTHKTPDFELYGLYCYPSKTIAALIQVMVLDARLQQADSPAALTIARHAADYLISTSEPAGTPMQFLPPTYAGDRATAGKYRGQIMMIYPARVGEAYLGLYAATHDLRYLRAARHIADTYVKTQLSSGSWPLVVVGATGKPTSSHLVIPYGICSFLTRLINRYSGKRYVQARNAAENWIMENPARTFYWEGQFEDNRPGSAYDNISYRPACGVALMLLDRHPHDPASVAAAEEMLRFAEDQFVIWEKPLPDVHNVTPRWTTPCVLEQYYYYVPIDSGAAYMIRCYQKTYEVTGKELYLAKARAIANALTFVQDPLTGAYPTYWGPSKALYWLNCMVDDIEAMVALQEGLEAESKAKGPKTSAPVR